MKLTRTMAYALQAILQLAQADSETPVPCSQLATEGNMPERFLLQILRNLVAHGILESTRGIQGGYRLGRKPDDISLLEVFEAIEGPMTAVIPGDHSLPNASRTKLERALSGLAETSRRELAAVKLSHLLPDGRRSRDGRPAASLS